VDSEVSGSLLRLLKQLSSVYNSHMRNVIKNIIFFTLFSLLSFHQSLNDHSIIYFTAVHHTSVYGYGCVVYRLLALHSSAFYSSFYLILYCILIYCYTVRYEYIFHKISDLLNYKNIDKSTISVINIGS